MSGIRIQHATARSVTFTLVDGGRPYREALVCRALMVIRGELRPCARTHTHKAYHLTLPRVLFVDPVTGRWTIGHRDPVQ